MAVGRCFLFVVVTLPTFYKSMIDRVMLCVSHLNVFVYKSFPLTSILLHFTYFVQADFKCKYDALSPRFSPLVSDVFSWFLYFCAISWHAALYSIILLVCCEAVDCE